MNLQRRAARAMNSTLRRGGFEVRRVRAPEVRPDAAFRENAKAIRRRHAAQTLEDVAALEEKYAAPVLGEVSVWHLVELQFQCIDPSDGGLFLASQGVHALQMLEGMERDGVTDDELVVAALVHDVGKVLLLTGEDPANVVCGNEPIGTYPDAVGLDHCVFQWNHDEFGYTRFKDHVSDPIAWFIRYHSISTDRCVHLMDDRDLRYTEKYLRLMQRYDQGTKSPFHLPARHIDEYRGVIEAAFPTPILF